MKRPRSHEDSDHSDSTDIQGPSVADLYVMGLYTSGQSIKQPDCTAALTLINLSLSRPGPSAAELHDWFEDLNQGASHDQKALSEAEDDDTEALTPTSRHASESHHHHHLLHDHSHVKAQRQHTPSPSPKHAAAAAHAHPAEGVQSCLQCGSTDTPLWRTGPLGPKTLCNACGVKFSRHQQKGKPGVKHHAAKKVKLASPHSPSNSDSPLA